eukprot:m.108350 g.108350  ORF g.108350 m.108350 type:complete len:105 (-) comp13959_c0_seq4:555-869(-)
MAHKLLYLLRKPSTNPILVAGNPLLRKAASQVDLTDVKAGKLKETVSCTRDTLNLFMYTFCIFCCSTDKPNGDDYARARGKWISCATDWHLTANICNGSHKRIC